MSSGLAKLKLSARERHGLVVAALCVLVFLTDRFIFRRLTLRLDAIGRQIEVSKRELAGNLKILDPARKRLVRQEYRRVANRIRKRRTTDEEDAALLAEVETLAEKAGVKLVGTRREEVRQAGFYEEYAVAIEFVEPLEKAVEFLYALESSPRLLHVQRISLSPSSKEPGAPLKGAMLITQVLTL